MSSSTAVVQRLVYEGVPAVFWTKERNKDERTYWVAEWYLLDQCAGLKEEYLRKARSIYKNALSPAQSKKQVMKDNGASWRFMRKEKHFFYDYNRIPSVGQSQYQMQLGTLKTLEDLFKESKVVDERTNIQEGLVQAIQEGWKDYTHTYLDYEKKHQEKITKACASTEAIINVINERKVDIKRMDFWKMVAKEVKVLDIPYLPQNHRRLKSKVLEASNSSIRDTLNLPRLGNKNAASFTDDKELKGWLIQLRSMASDKNENIKKKVISMCELTDKAIPSDGWFNGFFAKPSVKLLTAEGRFGKNSKRANILKGYVPIENALFAGDCWQMDATRINMIDFKKDVNVNGKVLKRAEFLMKIVVMDVHSGDAVGIHIDTKEDRIGYMAALSMAVKRTGYLPYQIIFDRFPGHNTEEFKAFVVLLENMGVKVDFVHKASHKAKQERLWKTLQDVFYQNSPYFYGDGITSRSITARKSDEYLNRIRKQATKEGWNWSAYWSETIKVVDSYRNTPRCRYSRKYSKEQRSPAEVHEQSEKPNVFCLDNWKFMLLFGGRSKWTIRNNIVVLQILEQERIYFIDDHNLITNYMGRQLMVRYDYEDLNTLYFFDEHNRNVGTASLQNRVQVYGPAAEWNNLAKLKVKNAAFERSKQDEYNESVGHIVHEVDMLLGALGDKYAANAAEDNYLIEEFDRIEHKKMDNRKVKAKVLKNVELQVMDVRNLY